MSLIYEGFYGPFSEPAVLIAHFHNETQFTLEWKKACDMKASDWAKSDEMLFRVRTCALIRVRVSHQLGQLQFAIASVAVRDPYRTVIDRGAAVDTSVCFDLACKEPNNPNCLKGQIPDCKNGKLLCVYPAPPGGP